MKAAPEQFRDRKHLVLGSDSSCGNNGFFVIPHPRIDKYFIHCMVSDGMGFEHVSVTIQSKKRKVERCPTWEEMCIVKNTFWSEDETVIQYHPPKSEYVSTHPYCLHLWKPIGIEIPLPNKLMVGVPGDNVQSY